MNTFEQDFKALLKKHNARMIFEYERSMFFGRFSAVASDSTYLFQEEFSGSKFEIDADWWEEDEKTTKLKFFRVDIAPNRNYARVVSSHFFLEGFDYNEITLLKRWFKEYLRCSSFSRNNVQIMINGSRLWLSSEFSDKDIFENQELLEIRLDHLAAVEYDFFEKIEALKQPKF